MKNLIIISALIINSVFGQLVVEQTLTNEDIGFTYNFVFKQEIKRNYDYNEDGVSEIIVADSYGRTYYIYDLKNSTILDTTPEFPNGQGWFEWIGIENITCVDCKNLIFRSTNQTPTLKLVDFQNNAIYDLGTEENLYTISDIDGDGEKEVVYEPYGSSYIEILGTGNTTALSANNINPFSFQLNQNYPNPFNPTTSISYQVQLSGDVTLNIYDVLGNRIKTLIDEPKAIGDYEIKWDGTNQMGERLSSGQYFYQLKVGDFVSTKKMVLLK